MNHDHGCKFGLVRRPSRTIGLLCLGLVWASLAGCGDSNATGTLQVYPVTGKVLKADGSPLTTGRVVLVSTAKGMEFSGDLSPDGSFAIKTSYGDGAPEGEYSVRIEPDPAALPASKGRTPRRPGANLSYPAKYTDESTSGLTVTVKPTDNALEPFKLTPDSPASKGDGDRR